MKDFPSIPYAWDREIRKLSSLGLSEAALAGILGKNAIELFTLNILRSHK